MDVEKAILIHQKRKKHKHQKEYFKTYLTVNPHLLFVEHADLHPTKSTFLKEHDHVYFTNTCGDCLKT